MVTVIVSIGAFILALINLSYVIEPEKGAPDFPIRVKALSGRQITFLYILLFEASDVGEHLVRSIIICRTRNMVTLGPKWQP